MKGNTDPIRIPMLVTEERFATRLHVHHQQTHLFLCISAQEIGELVLESVLAFANQFRLKLLSLDIFRNPENETPNTIDIGFD